MGKLTSILLASAAALVATPALAGSFSNCEVLEIVAAEGQNAHVRLNCVITDPPPCAPGAPWVGFDKQTVDGKQWLALFIYAQAVNAKVTGWTYNSCPTFQSNVAQLAHLRITR